MFFSLGHEMQVWTVCYYYISGGSVPVFDEIILSTSLMNKIYNIDATAGI